MQCPCVPTFSRPQTSAASAINDLLVAAKGGSTVYLLAGKGDGTFLAPRALAFDGAVSALKAWRGPAGQNLLVASICGASGCGLQIVTADGTAAGFIAVGSPVSSFEVAAVNGGGTPDLSSPLPAAKRS